MNDFPINELKRGHKENMLLLIFNTAMTQHNTTNESNDTQWKKNKNILTHFSAFMSASDHSGQIVNLFRLASALAAPEAALEKILKLNY